MIPDWSMEPEAMDIMIAWITKHKPKVVVELGSGMSTARFAPHIQGTFYSYESDSNFYQRTQKLVEGMNVDLRFAPLIDGAFSGDFPDGIDLLIVDGPQGIAGKLTRLPTIEKIKDKLKGNIFMHDAIRPEERQIAEMLGTTTYYDTPNGLVFIKL